MLEAVIFDFDGVVVDSEPIHMDCFRQVVRPYGVTFTDEEYYARYLSYSDREAFLRMVDGHDLGGAAVDVDALIARKTALVQQALATAATPLPGAIELMAATRRAGLALAICSAALRREVELPLERAGALDLVQVIVAAEDVHIHKPDPAGYIETCRRLGAALGRDLAAGACVAIEDSPGGIVAAKAAGLAVLAVTNTLAADRLAHADRVVDSLASVALDDLRQLTA
ncbi:MAG: HAD family phosphatase [Planctomycetes bacterium]|nr:HAD family phosphatase [Planctomycetota bacterium]